jgi:hypothetical protein
MSALLGALVDAVGPWPPAATKQAAEAAIELGGCRT